jgi:hypothetical protein
MSVLMNFASEMKFSFKCYKACLIIYLKQIIAYAYCMSFGSLAMDREHVSMELAVILICNQTSGAEEPGACPHTF